jgi:hypothetical protein
VGAYSGGVTLITVYGGTDYTLAATAITLPYYSMMKVPFGFPANPTKWMVEIKDTAGRTQATPTQNTWYNINAALSISIPIGEWLVSYQAIGQLGDSTSTSWAIYLTLSTANNSESDINFTTRISGGAITDLAISLEKNKYLTLASKTPYYLNIRTVTANLDNMYIRSDVGTTIIRAVCAYL